MSLKYYLITYQQRIYGREIWAIANDVTTDPGQWLVEQTVKFGKEAATVLLSAIEVNGSVYEILKDLL